MPGSRAWEGGMATTGEESRCVIPSGESCEGEGAKARLLRRPTTAPVRNPEADAKHSARLRDGRNTGERANATKMEVIESNGSGGRPALQVAAKVHLASAPGSEYWIKLTN